ncbi:PREDICTED: uncharacterized protein LOC106816647, partial [Priapulus caudatus]|uniref:Uncharacterized protein LOC106816647 n=1 Tax=Priapulus caudatus TaxID=37621 RepID=A0ABM1EX37_PRICU
MGRKKKTRYAFAAVKKDSLQLRRSGKKQRLETVQDAQPGCSSWEDQQKFTISSTSSSSDDSSGEECKADTRIMSMASINHNLKEAAVCRVCKKGSIQLKERGQRHGFGTRLALLCSNRKCKKTYKINSSSFHSSRKTGKQYDINKKVIFAMRCIGRGRRGLLKFASICDMPKPLSPGPYSRLSKEMATRLDDDLLEEVLLKSAIEVKQMKVSAGGACSSEQAKIVLHNETAMQELVVDIAVHVSRWLMAEERVFLAARPDCHLNHFGSAGSMEAQGAKILWERSVEKYGLRYTTFVGDGDSSAFSMIEK